MIEKKSNKRHKNDKQQPKRIHLSAVSADGHGFVALGLIACLFSLSVPFLFFVLVFFFAICRHPV